jgi:hypothetical protein
MTKIVIDVETLEPPTSTTNEDVETNLEDLTKVLDSLQIFSLSSSQIPTKQKSLLLSDLVKLSLPDVIFVLMIM